MVAGRTVVHLARLQVADAMRRIVAPRRMLLVALGDVLHPLALLLGPCPHLVPLAVPSVIVIAVRYALFHGVYHDACHVVLAQKGEMGPVTVVVLDIVEGDDAQRGFGANIGDDAVCVPEHDNVVRTLDGAHVGGHEDGMDSPFRLA